MQVTGQVTVMSVKGRISFESRMTMPMDYKTTRLEGIVWLPDGEAKAPVALTNVGRQPITVTLKAGGAMGAKPVNLGVRETRLVDAGELVSGAQKSFLLTLQHNGSPGDLIAAGAVLNTKTGYSSTLELVDWTAGVSNTLAGAHFLFGAADAHSGLPDHARFRAPLVLANVGPSPTQVVVSVDYTAKGNPQHVHIDQVMLKPGEVRGMDLADRLAAVGVHGSVEDAGVDISYNGAPGSVLAKLSSVDQSGDYSFDMPIKDPLSSAPYRVSGSYPWRLDSGYTTVVHIKNTTAREVHAAVQVRFASGQYAPPRIHLAPFQTVAVDLAALRREQKTDLDGNVFPLNATTGSVLWPEEAPGSLIGRAETVNIGLAVASSFSCNGACTCGYQTVSTYISPSSLSMILHDGTHTITMKEVRKFCNYSQSTYDVTSTSNCWTTNGFVDTLSGPVVTAVAVGTGGVEASISTIGWDVVLDQCTYPTQNPTAPVYVQAQVPTYLSIVSGTDSTTSEGACTTSGGLAGCGVTRTFKYQVLDQSSQPIRLGGMSFSDSISASTPNTCNLTGFTTTPPGQVTDANGQFNESLNICAPACKSGSMCTTGCSTSANQTWTVAGHNISKSLSYQCNTITVN